MAAIREHITRDGDTRCTATVRRKGSNRASYSKTFDTRKAAEDWAANEERQIKEQRKAGAVHQVRYVRDAIQRYREDPDVKSTLKTDDKHVLDWWSSQLGDKRLSLTPIDDGHHLLPSNIYDVREELRRKRARTGPNKGAPLTPASVNRRVARLSSALTYAKERLGWITENPARIRRVSGERAISAEEALLTGVEFDALLDAAKADECPYAYTWVMSGLAFGPRAGELAKLRWRDVDVDAEEATLRDTKNGRTYRVALGFAAPLFKKLRDDRKVVDIAGDDLVFVPERAPAKVFHHRPFWDRVRAKAGLLDRGYRFHNLRHCFASLAARGGMAHTELMLAMRHQSASMTLRYSHLMGSSGRARVAELVTKAAREHGGILKD